MVLNEYQLSGRRGSKYRSRAYSMNRSLFCDRPMKSMREREGRRGERRGEEKGEGRERGRVGAGKEEGDTH